MEVLLVEVLLVVVLLLEEVGVMPELVVEVVGTETEKTPLVVVIMALDGVVVVVVKPSDVVGLPSFPTFGQFVESILNCD